MGQIHVLDQNTINQIAAGEVIDRPASVVKELLENAIDAGSTAVTVETKDGGLSLIRITDNGCGIAKDDIRNAFLRHATSKITSAEDLLSVSSLGFRGEALSSIAAVCQVELITKTRDSVTGISYRIEGGEEKAFEEIGAPDGTTFLVRNIFFNTPARRKFLKTAQTEGIYISEMVERIALSHPEVSIRLIQNGQNKLYTTGNDKLKDVIYTVFGREIAGNLLPIKLKLSGLSVTGFLGKPVIARGNRSFENYFINGRYIKSRIIYKAIEDAYKPYMMQHKYPFTVLSISIPSELLDVNVHPSKMELRFRQEEALYRELVKVISETLAGKELIVETKLEDEKPVKKYPAGKETFVEKKETEGKGTSTVREASGYKPARAPEPFETNRFDAERIKQLAQMGQEYVKSLREEERPKMTEELPKPIEEKKSEALQADNKIPENQEKTSLQKEKSEERKDVEQLELFDDKLLSRRARSRHKLIGQLFETYWLIEYEDKLYIIDQHAAHEKVLFERTMKQMKDRTAMAQYISPPAMLHLSDRERMTLEQHLEHFQKLGFELEPFGGNSYAMTAIPSNLFSLNQVELFLELLDEMTQELGTSGSQMILDKVASMSCKAAVKGNMRLSVQEADALIEELLTLDNPYACPHGRPTIISMSKYDLEKKFKRIV